MPSPDLPPVTSRGFAQIHLPAIVRLGLEKKFATRSRNAAGDLVETIGGTDEPDEIYMRARAMGEDPTRYVANQLGISQGAAAQRIARARKAGLLPPTTRGER